MSPIIFIFDYIILLKLNIKTRGGNLELKDIFKNNFLLLISHSHVIRYII